MIIKNEIIILHSAIRNLLKKNTFLEVINSIYKDIFIFKNSYCKKKSSKKISIKKIENILKCLYLYKEKNLILGNCVSFALTIFMLLIMNDYKPKYVIGTREDDFKLYAHAWIEVNDISIDIEYNKRQFKIIKVIDLFGDRNEILDSII